MPAFSVGAASTFAVTTSGNQGITGTKTFTSATVGSTALIVKAMTSQTADLQQWQNSSGTVLTSIEAPGIIRLFASDPTGGAYLNWSGTAANKLRGTGPTSTPLVVQGQASQTANLQEWQNSSGTSVASLNANGHIVSAGNYSTTSVTQGYAIYASGDTPSKLVMGVRGAAAQTANLQEWLNSSGTVLAQIDSNGAIRSYTSSQVISSTPSQQLFYGKSASGQSAPMLEFQNSAGASTMMVTASGAIFIAKNAGPSSNSAGGFLWTNTSGTLYYRNPSGADTQLAG
jgi:hypothetical protein